MDNELTPEEEGYESPLLYDEYDFLQEEQERMQLEQDAREREHIEQIERAQREEMERMEREQAEQNTFFYTDDVGDGYDDDGFWH